MALSGLDIYKLLPKTNCRECGFVTCLAYAMQLAKKAVSIEKCPYLSAEAKKILLEQGQPPIRTVVIGSGDAKIETGDETVMFRHEEKFRHPCGIGFVLEDGLSDKAFSDSINAINQLAFERVGQKLSVNLLALKQKSGKDDFIKAVKSAVGNSGLALVLMALDLTSLREALKITADKRPLIYCPQIKDYIELAKLAREFNAGLVLTEGDLERLSGLTAQVCATGLSDIVLDTGNKPLPQKLWDLTQIRRQALKKSNRSLGFPVLTFVEEKDSYMEAALAATYVAKYSSIVLLNGIEPWKALALLTLRQNIYTDPQKPLQVEPGLYPAGEVSDSSPVLITTNFSLSYYTVLGEVESSKIPSYILSVDTEGMSVLTAWAAEKFTPEKIAESIKRFEVGSKVRHRNVVIPGYVAVLSGDLQENSGLKVIVGPKEAAGIPSFLKNLS